MDKTKLDQLYHDLRELCVTTNDHQKEAVLGITTHLLNPGGDYTGLLRFLSYYGERFIVPDVVKLIRSSEYPLKFSRIVELGSGFGWLGRGISASFNNIPAVFIDKRQWAFTDIVADIETENGIKRVIDELKDGDLIVMSELLHCLANPAKILQQFAKWPMLIVEYSPVNRVYQESYNSQIKKFGCEPIASFSGSSPNPYIVAGSTDTHLIWLVLPSQEKENSFTGKGRLA